MTTRAQRAAQHADMIEMFIKQYALRHGIEALIRLAVAGLVDQQLAQATSALKDEVRQVAERFITEGIGVPFGKFTLVAPVAVALDETEQVSA